MPEIGLYRKPYLISDDRIRLLTGALRTAVARLLTDNTVTDGALTPEQVEVRVSDGHRLDDNTCDVAIKIAAQHTPAREANHDAIVDELTLIAQGIVPPMVGEPERPVDTWLELDLGHRKGRKIWP